MGQKQKVPATYWPLSVSAEMNSQPPGQGQSVLGRSKGTVSHLAITPSVESCYQHGKSSPALKIVQLIKQS